MSTPTLAIVIQGPLWASTTPGGGTRAVLEHLAAAQRRDEFLIALAVWEDDDEELLRPLERLVDRVIRVQRPDRAGSGNRVNQAVGVTSGLLAAQAMGVGYAVKSRTDVVLGEEFLARGLAAAAASDGRLLTTTLITRWEPFHLSDIVVGGTTDRLLDLFDPRTTYYEDAYSPEVQFARAYVRNRRLRYTNRLEDWLRFLADHVDLVDFDEMGLVWLKRGGPIRVHWYSRSWPYLVDRDLGPVLARPVSVRAHRWLRRTHVPPLAVATLLRCLDPIAELVLRALPFDVHDRVGSPFHRYWVAPQTPEHARPLEPVRREAGGRGVDEVAA